MPHLIIYISIFGIFPVKDHRLFIVGVGRYISACGDEEFVASVIGGVAVASVGRLPSSMNPLMASVGPLLAPPVLK